MSYFDNVQCTSVFGWLQVNISSDTMTRGCPCCHVGATAYAKFCPNIVSAMEQNQYYMLLYCIMALNLNFIQSLDLLPTVCCCGYCHQP